jgi:hypothetical protein
MTRKYISSSYLKLYLRLMKMVWIYTAHNVSLFSTEFLEIFLSSLQQMFIDLHFS